MSASERRDLVLTAAATAFARGGWRGTSTRAVGRESGVSQSYVVRMFGSKIDLFRELFARAFGGVVDAFGAELDRIDAE
ncbi:TetR/AcrR family transcriptional regulator [Rhodococcus opacus]|uniref:HTH tetR-type domain-containing protein n=1 Tax=Rhodococcus opacus TaxID=37919 RepID=A0A2S8IXJ5_RHOOP|nr:hypothetical protein C5613_30000 [Rhodococcus opacus]